jgi:hypothetical protein
MIVVINPEKLDLEGLARAWIKRPKDEAESSQDRRAGEDFCAS